VDEEEARKLLGLDRGKFTAEELEHAWKRAAKPHHPDNLGRDPDPADVRRATYWSQRINAAHDLLKARISDDSFEGHGGPDVGQAAEARARASEAERAHRAREEAEARARAAEAERVRRAREEAEARARAAEAERVRRASAILFMGAALLGVATQLTASVETLTPNLHWAIGFGEDQPLVVLAVVCACLAGLLQLTAIPFRRLVSVCLGVCALGSYVWTIADVGRNPWYISVGPGWYLLLAAMFLGIAGVLAQIFLG
jgi:hypothetical protein